MLNSDTKAKEEKADNGFTSKIRTAELRGLFRAIEEKYDIGWHKNDPPFTPNMEFIEELRKLKRRMDGEISFPFPEPSPFKDEILSSRNIHCATASLACLSRSKIDWFRAWCEMCDIFDHKQDEDCLYYDEIAILSIVLQIYIYTWCERGTDEAR